MKERKREKANAKCSTSTRYAPGIATYRKRTLHRAEHSYSIERSGSFAHTQKHKTGQRAPQQSKKEVRTKQSQVARQKASLAQSLPRSSIIHRIRYYSSSFVRVVSFWQRSQQFTLDISLVQSALTTHRAPLHCARNRNQIVVVLRATPIIIDSFSIIAQNVSSLSPSSLLFCCCCC